MTTLQETTVGAVVRDATREDIPAIAAIHEEVGLDYEMPDLNNSIFFVKKVIEVDGEIVGASALRIEAETYLWLKRGDWGDTEAKKMAMQLLQDALLSHAFALGVPTVVCWVPRHIERFFAKDLKELGWSRDREGWISWSRSTYPQEK